MYFYTGVRWKHCCTISLRRVTPTAGAPRCEVNHAGTMTTVKNCHPKATLRLAGKSAPIYAHHYFKCMCITDLIIISFRHYFHTHYRPPRPRAHPRPRSPSRATCSSPRRCARSSRSRAPICPSVKLERSWVHVGVPFPMLRRPSTRRIKFDWERGVTTSPFWEGRGDSSLSVPYGTRRIIFYLSVG